MKTPIPPIPEPEYLSEWALKSKEGYCGLGYLALHLLPGYDFRQHPTVTECAEALEDTYGLPYEALYNMVEDNDTAKTQRARKMRFHKNCKKIGITLTKRTRKSCKKSTVAACQGCGKEEE